MSNSTKATVVVTAAQVRAFYRAEPKRLARLSPEAQATVAEGAKGRLHPKVIADHNKTRRSARYVAGTERKAAVAKAQANAEQRKALAAAGVKVGARGPLPKA